MDLLAVKTDLPVVCSYWSGSWHLWLRNSTQYCNQPWCQVCSSPFLDQHLQLVVNFLACHIFTYGSLALHLFLRAPTGPLEIWHTSHTKMYCCCLVFLCTSFSHRISKEDRTAGILDNYKEGKLYKDHGLREYLKHCKPEIMPTLNSYLSDSKWFVSNLVFCLYWYC